MTAKEEFLSPSENATIDYAKKFSKTLKPGTVIALKGDLGSGKTTFIKGIALGLGLKDRDDVKSPTFALMHVYETRPVIYHFDLYRLETEPEIANIGFEEFVNDTKAITCVEWAERAKTLIPKKAVTVDLSVAGESQRRIVIS